MDMAAYLIDNATSNTPACDIPCTKDLASIFGCPFEFITSIGWAVRNDYVFPPDLDSYGTTESERKFQYFQRKYPTLNGLMDDVYELLPGYYGGRTYFVRKSMAYQSPVVAGDGWFAIGNSAGFTNPLLSPGINAGIGTAYLAAMLTRDVLARPEDASPVTRRSAQRYQSYSHDFMMPRLQQMNRFWYTAFRDHGLFAALVPCFWACGVDAIDPHYTGTFNDKDLQWLVGAGGDGFQELCEGIFAVVDPLGSGPVNAEAVERVREMSSDCLARRKELYPTNAWGKYLRKYDNNLQRSHGKSERDSGGKFAVVQCRLCKIWVHNETHACPICGADRLEKEKSSWPQMWFW